MPDAVAALRSMGRRWTELFEDVPPERLSARGAGGRSPVELAGLAAREVREAGSAMDAALSGRSADAPGPGVDRVATEGPDEAVAAVEASAAAVAESAAGARPEQFTRTGEHGGSEADAGWMLRHAVHRASHRLREAERLLGPA